MAKPSDFYIGVLDFFGSLLPGAVTLGGAIGFRLPTPDPSRIEALKAEWTQIGAFLVLAYVVGQVANSLGSFVLDFLFDILYTPGEGIFSKTRPKQPEPVPPANLAGPVDPAGAGGSMGLSECAKSPRADEEQEPGAEEAAEI